MPRVPTIADVEAVVAARPGPGLTLLAAAQAQRRAEGVLTLEGRHLVYRDFEGRVGGRWSYAWPRMAREALANARLTAKEGETP